jgi:hypothetical protein
MAQLSEPEPPEYVKTHLSCVSLQLSLVQPLLSLQTTAAPDWQTPPKHDSWPLQ